MIRLPTILGLTFLAYAGASALWSPHIDPWAVANLALLATAYGLGLWLEDMFFLWFLFIIWMVCNLCLMLLPDLPFGLYGNPNALGCALALAIVGALAYGMWPFIIPAVIGLWITQSRGALAATAIVLAYAAWRRYWYYVLTVAILALFLAGTTFAPRGSDSIMARLGIWQDTLNHLTIFGNGLGSFFDTYYNWPTHINMVPVLERPAHAYNDILELLFEFGIGTIPLWLLLIYAFSAQTDDRAILATFGLLSLTYYPLFILPLGLLFAATLGHLTRSSYGQERSQSWPLRLRTGLAGRNN